jgi:hypothetical protein
MNETQYERGTEVDDEIGNEDGHLDVKNINFGEDGAS